MTRKIGVHHVAIHFYQSWRFGKIAVLRRFPEEKGIDVHFGGVGSGSDKNER